MILGMETRDLVCVARVMDLEPLKARESCQQVSHCCLGCLVPLAGCLFSLFIAWLLCLLRGVEQMGRHADFWSISHSSLSSILAVIILTTAENSPPVPSCPQHLLFKLIVPNVAQCWSHWGWFKRARCGSSPPGDFG